MQVSPMYYVFVSSAPPGHLRASSVGGLLALLAHRANGGLDFPRQFPDDHCQASAASKSHWGFGGGAPEKILGYINVVQVTKVVEKKYISVPR